MRCTCTGIQESGWTLACRYKPV